MDHHIWPSKTEWPARIYIQQLCEDTAYNPEDLPEAMNDGRSGERGSGISVLVAGHDDDDFAFIDQRELTSLFQNSLRFADNNI